MMLLSLLLTVSAFAWEIQREVDLMTDRTVLSAVTTTAEGDALLSLGCYLQDGKPDGNAVAYTVILGAGILDTSPLGSSHTLGQVAAKVRYGTLPAVEMSLLTPLDGRKMALFPTDALTQEIASWSTVERVLVQVPIYAAGPRTFVFPVGAGAPLLDVARECGLNLPETRPLPVAP